MAKTLTFRPLEPTQEWRIIDGVIHRVWVARRSDGATRLVAYRDNRVAA